MLAYDERLDRAKPRTIRAARQKTGLSMFALARLAGVDRATVHRIEQGRQTPTPRTLGRLFRALERTAPDELELARARAVRGTRKHLRDLVPFEADPVARYAAAVHPDGLEVDQVAKVLGLSPSVVDVTQARAFAKLEQLASQPGAAGDAARAWLDSFAAAREARDDREAAPTGGAHVGCRVGGAGASGRAACAASSRVCDKARACEQIGPPVVGSSPPKTTRG